MTGTLRFSLRHSLALADDSLRAAAPTPATLAFGLAAEDPLRLDLPPLAGGGGLLPGPQFLRVAGSLYLHAELEQAGVVAVAELLAGQRRTLDLTSERAARLLEEFARRARQWYDRDSRTRLFARLFGTGASAARPGEGREVNREFQQLLANLCGATLGYGEQYRFRQRPTPAQEALVRQVATDLLVNLGARQYGNATAATQIQDQLRRAIELLSDEGIGARFQARGLWDILRKILGRETPDLGRLVTRGQAGQRLLEWLASALPQITETQASAPLLPAGSPVFALAASWLEASGFSVDSRGAATQRVA